MRQTSIAPALLRQITEAIRSIRFGTVQITVHDARVVQIEKLERVRVSPLADLTTEGDVIDVPTDRISGGSRQLRGS